MTCRCCGGDLPDICFTCEEQQLEIAFREADKQRQSEAKRYRLVEINNDGNDIEAK